MDSWRPRQERLSGRRQCPLCYIIGVPIGFGHMNVYSNLGTIFSGEARGLLLESEGEKGEKERFCDLSAQWLPFLGIENL